MMKAIRQKSAETTGKKMPQEMNTDSQAQEIAKIIDQPTADRELDALYPIFSKFNKNFEAFEPIDNS